MNIKICKIKPIHILLIIVSCIIFFLITLKNTAYLDNWNPSVVIYKHSTNLSSKPLYKNTSIVIPFTAYENNLGITSLLFNIKKRLSKGVILFTLNENNTIPIYSNKYYTDQFVQNVFFTFGFPTIQNSKGRQYTITITGLTGSENDYVSLDKSKSLISKYQFLKKDLFENKINLFYFTFSHIRSFFNNLDLLDYSFLFLPLVFLIIVYYLFPDIYLWSNKYAEFFFRCVILHIKELLFGTHQRSLEFYCVLIYFGIFFNIAYFSPYTRVIKQSLKVILFISLYNMFLLYYLIKIKDVFAKILLKIRRLDIYLALTAFIVLILRYQYIDTFFRWDSASYFTSIASASQLFDFSHLSFLQNFSLFGHPSHGYALYMSLGQMLQPYNLQLAQTQNLVLMLITVVAFYKILRIVVPNQTSLSYVLFTLCFACNPLFFASSVGCHLDFASICFFIIMLWFYISNRMILYLFAAIFLVFSKEIGMLVYFLFIFSLGISFLFKHKKQTFTIRWFIHSIPLFLFLLIYLFNNGRLWVGETTSITPLIYFTWTNIKVKISELFILNFSWIYVLGILTSFILILVYNKKIKIDQRWKGLFFALIITYTGFILFNISFHSVSPPRYILLSIFFLLFFWYVLVINIIQSKILQIGIIIAILCVSYISINKTIDPISKLVFGTYKFGKHDILSISDTFSARCDIMIYNLQYANMDKLLNAFNKEIKINQNKKIIISMLSDTRPYGKSGRWAYDWLHFFHAFIDKDTFQRTWINVNSFRPTYLNSIYLTNINIPKDEVYYLFLPWLSLDGVDHDLLTIKKFYNLGKRNRIEIDGYFIEYYKINRL